MTHRDILIPRQKAPDLSAKIVCGGTWRLSEARAQNFTLVVFYRGLHCPICRGYLAKLNGIAGDLAERGVKTIVLSTDSSDRAQRVRDEWDLDELTLGYGVSIAAARSWGLFISTGNGTTSMGVEEPVLFAEPGVFLFRPDGTLYFSNIQTMPFARPDLTTLPGAIDFVLKKNYPARGEA